MSSAVRNRYCGQVSAKTRAPSGARRGCLHAPSARRDVHDKHRHVEQARERHQRGGGLGLRRSDGRVMWNFGARCRALEEAFGQPLDHLVVLGVHHHQRLLARRRSTSSICPSSSRARRSCRPSAIREGHGSLKVFMTYDKIGLTTRSCSTCDRRARENRALVCVHAENHGMIAWMSSAARPRPPGAKYHALEPSARRRGGGLHSAHRFAGFSISRS